MKKAYAALIAPAIIPLLFFSGKMIFFDRADSEYLKKTLFETLAGISTFSYFFSLLIGIPFVLVLSKFNRLNGVNLVVLGALGGLIAVIVILTYTSNISALSDSAFLLTICSAAGAVVSLLFVVLAKIPFRTQR